MDKAKIEAMRKLIDENERAVRERENIGARITLLDGIETPTAAVRLAVDGFRTLLNQASMIQAAAEQAEPVAASDNEEKIGAMRAAIRTAKGLWKQIEDSLDLLTMSPSAPATKATPTTAASDDGPTIEEHTDALNRGEYLGASDWTVVVTSQGADHTIDADVCGRVAEWLIAREKAAEGGG